MNVIPPTRADVIHATNKLWSITKNVSEQSENTYSPMFWAHFQIFLQRFSHFMHVIVQNNSITESDKLKYLIHLKESLESSICK
jgi:hypothetical protein